MKLNKPLEIELKKEEDSGILTRLTYRVVHQDRKAIPINLDRYFGYVRFKVAIFPDIEVDGHHIIIYLRGQDESMDNESNSYICTHSQADSIMSQVNRAFSQLNLKYLKGELK